MPFAKGQSGNPAGRPVGSRNRFTREMDEALEQHGVAVIEKIVTHAHAANPAAMRLCLDRLVPQGKNRPFSVELPSVDTTDYVIAALSEVQRALGAGEITTEEAARLVDLVGRTARVLASKAAAEIDFADRLARVEEALVALLNADTARHQQGARPSEAAPSPAPEVKSEGVIANNNGKTMDTARQGGHPAAPSAGKAAPSVPAAQRAEPPPVAKNNEDPVLAAALDKAVQAAFADVRTPRRNSVKEELTSSASPSAPPAGETTEKVLARKTKSVMPALALPARAA
ncbi:MAG TPA: DUF5681 domain-containing protein [Xanthobacteraceae bacterium]|nr:DUF5681 domain-containing protein [Xanthobacteraceae bacterium]